ncbi:hypothetical protein Metbo_0500 [Methanobacterium lacus]|uniref:Uncharacterized protein n=1 Tax=Methanobacterium lacus (strain AL-21) TaxID=877455 RepID=F0T9K4_METLA|nr:hypothetical protein [Methanobacterium lacus]ADZ08752.1 hypothetical protein Metbo_0500 [Methanobacterium lacus]
MVYISDLDHHFLIMELKLINVVNSISTFTLSFEAIYLAKERDM